MTDKNLDDVFETAYTLELHLISAKRLISRLNAEYEKFMQKTFSRTEICGQDPEKPKKEFITMKRKEPVKPERTRKKTVKKGAVRRTILFTLLFTVIAFVAVVMINIPSETSSMITYLSELGPINYVLFLLISLGIGLGIALLILLITVLVVFLINLFAQKEDEKKDWAYKQALSSYEAEKKDVEYKNQLLDIEYQKKLNEYYDELKRRDEITHNKENEYHNVKCPAIMSRIKKALLVEEGAKKILDVLYQQNELENKYRDIVHTYVFRYYLWKHECNDIDELIKYYHEEEKMNNIPMATDIKAVKEIRSNVEKHILDFIQKVDSLSTLQQSMSSILDSFIYEMYTDLEKAEKDFQINRRL